MQGESIEIAIKIIVTLFVALVVGGVIILFAQRTLLGAEANLQNVGKTPDGTQIVSLGNTATSDDVMKLADSCARTNSGSSQDVVCFVVRGELPDVSSLDGEVAAGFPIEVSADDATSIFITYSARGVIEITS